MKFPLLLIILLLASCAKEKTVPPPPPSPIHAATVEVKDVPLFLDTIGHVEPMATVNINSRVKGQIVGVYFKEGDFVKKGDLLFAIDPRIFQANLDKAKATLLQNIATAEIAQEKVTRYTSLTKDEYFSQLDYDQLKSNVDQLNAVIKQNQADIDLAAINLDYCWIYSPIDGRSGILQIQEGNWVKDDESQTLVVVSQISPIYVTFSIPENALHQVKEYCQQSLLQTRASFNDLAKNYFQGELEMVDNMVDQNTGMVKLRSTFPNKQEELWPGQFVRTRLILTTRPKSVIIPYQAVSITTTGTYVFIVKEDRTIEMRAVKLGQREDENVIVLDGLQGGETIATDGLVNLYPGVTVSIKNSNEKSP